jgi:hypothetical protein
MLEIYLGAAVCTWKKIHTMLAMSWADKIGLYGSNVNVHPQPITAI